MDKILELSVKNNSQFDFTDPSMDLKFTSRGLIGPFDFSIVYENRIENRFTLDNTTTTEIFRLPGLKAGDVMPEKNQVISIQ